MLWTNTYSIYTKWESIKWDEFILHLNRIILFISTFRIIFTLFSNAGKAMKKKKCKQMKLTGFENLRSRKIEIELNTKSVSIWLMATMYGLFLAFIYVRIGRGKSSLAWKRIYIIQHICKHDFSINFFARHNTHISILPHHFLSSFFV